MEDDVDKTTDPEAQASNVYASDGLDNIALTGHAWRFHQRALTYQQDVNCTEAHLDENNFEACEELEDEIEATGYILGRRKSKPEEKTFRTFLNINTIQ